MEKHDFAVLFTCDNGGNYTILIKGSFYEQAIKDAIVIASNQHRAFVSITAAPIVYQ